MTNVLPLSARIYGRLLAAYPAELRRDFGIEMALAFAEDLETARRDAGVRGVLRVWRCALIEFLRFALPGRLSSPAWRAPAIGVGFSVVSISLELLMARFNHDQPRFSVFAALPTFATFMTPVVITWVCRSRAVISLHLSTPAHEEESTCSKCAI